MKQDEIIEMARQAGMSIRSNWAEQELEAFAKLVRNDYSNKHAQLWLKRIDEAVKAEREEFAVHAVDIARRAIAEEREACAKVCDDIDAEYEGEDVLATWCSKAIRARGEA